MNAAILNQMNELDRLGKQRDDAWQIPLEEGRLLHQIALSAGATRILEIGTSYGFSGLFWGAALLQVGGHLETVDKDPKKFESSARTFAQAGLSDVITNHLGDAREVIPKFNGEFDIAFVDADKDSTQTYFDMIWPKIKLHGSLIVDNATTHRDKLKPFTERLGARADVRGAEVAVGNGILWVVKIDAGR